MRTICGTNINYRIDRNILDLQKLKARTKMKQIWFLELQYADDCAILCQLTVHLQEAIPLVAELYKRFELEENIRKTEVLHWSGKNPEANALDITNNDIPFQVASFFQVSRGLHGR